MADYYLASGFAQGELARAGSAGELLAWARDIAAQARPADVYRDKEGRKTLRFEYAGNAWFLKLHTGVGWAEVGKNLLQLRLPVISARQRVPRGARPAAGGGLHPGHRRLCAPGVEPGAGALDDRQRRADRHRQP